MIAPEELEEVRPTITKKEWVERLSTVKLSKQDLNKLVMNFFLIEGSSPFISLSYIFQRV